MSVLSVILSILFGLISGVFGGLGMGGGTLLIPLLTIFLQYPQKLAQGINLISFLAMALIGLYIHFKHGYVKTNGIIWIIIFGAIFSIFGAMFAQFMPTIILKRLFGGFLCLISIFQIVKIIKK